jgi:hypothetical protein
MFGRPEVAVRDSQVLSGVDMEQSPSAAEIRSIGWLLRFLLLLVGVAAIWLIAPASARADSALGGATDAVEQTTSGATDAVQQTSGATDAVEQTTSGSTDAVEQTTSGATDAVEQTTSGATDAVEQTIDDVADTVEQTTDDVAAAAGEITAGAVDSVTSTVGQVVDRSAALVDTAADDIPPERQVTAELERSMSNSMRDTLLSDASSWSTTLQSGTAASPLAEADATPDGAGHAIPNGSLPTAGSTAPQNLRGSSNANDLAAVLAAIVIALALLHWSRREAERSPTPVFLRLAERPG